MAAGEHAVSTIYRKDATVSTKMISSQIRIWRAILIALSKLNRIVDTLKKSDLGGEIMFLHNYSI